MFNVKLTMYPEFTQLRIYDRIITHDKKKKVINPLEQVPFHDDNFEPLVARRDDSCVLLPEEREFRKSESLRCSLSRTRKMIRHIALSFKPAYFATFTFSPQFVNRKDYDAVASLMQKYLRTLPSNVQYLVLPELHKDGAYHFHGIFSDTKDLKQAYYPVSHLPIPNTYNSSLFKFGFNSFQTIKSSTAVSFYITKYITKDLCAVSSGKKRYWYSRSTIKLAPCLNLLFTKQAIRDIIYLIKNHTGRDFYDSKCYFLKYSEIHLDDDICYDVFDFCSQFESSDGSCFCYSSS